MGKIMTFRGRSSKLISHNSTSCVDLDGFFGGSAKEPAGVSRGSFLKKLLQNDQRREYFRFDGEGSVFFKDDHRQLFRRVL